MQTLNRKKGGVGVVILLVMVALILVVFLSIWSGYNKAISLDEKTKNLWQQIDVQLTRRFDLIPNILETVKGYAQHEKELFTHIADARTKYLQADTQEAKATAANLLGGFMPKLLALHETYPDLKANDQFMALQVQLEGTENRIAVARKDYNESVRLLNTYARSLFGKMFCQMAGVEKAPYFEATEEKKAVPQVDFGTK